MKLKIMLFFLIFNFSSIMCSDYHNYEKVSGESSIGRTCESCTYFALNIYGYCPQCSVSLPNVAAPSVVRPPEMPAASAPPRDYNSSYSQADSDKKVKIEPVQCQQCIFDNTGYCTKCKKPDCYDDSTYPSDFGADAGSSDGNLTRGSKYIESVFVGCGFACTIALVYYLCKKLR